MTTSPPPIDVLADLRIDVDGRPAFTVTGSGGSILVTVVDPGSLPATSIRARTLLKNLLAQRSRIEGATDRLASSGLTATVATTRHRLFTAGRDVTGSRVIRALTGARHVRATSWRTWLSLAGMARSTRRR